MVDEAGRRERIGLVQIDESTEAVIVNMGMLVMQVEHVIDETLSAVVARLRDEQRGAAIFRRRADVHRLLSRQLTERRVIHDLTTTAIGRRLTQLQFIRRIFCRSEVRQEFPLWANRDSNPKPMDKETSPGDTHRADLG